MGRPRTLAEIAKEAALAGRLSAFLNEEKSTSGPIVWELDGRNLRFATTLEMDGITEPGVVLFGRASLHLRHRHVTLGVSWNDPKARGGNFDRLDWRPIDAHNNRALGPEEYRFTLIEGTHHHRLVENAELSMGLLQAIREGLPIALPVQPEPDAWAAFCELVAQRWHIEEILNTPEPPWQYDLALPPGRRGIGRGKQS